MIKTYNILCLLLVLAFFTTGTADDSDSDSDGGYLGCFIDTPYREFYFRKFPKDLTIESCIKLCKHNKFNYAALGDGNRCSCSDHFGKYGKVAESACETKRCPGNKDEHCGGVYRNRIFVTGRKPKSKGIKPLGCFNDDREKHDLGQSMIHFRYMRKEYCFRFCSKSNFKYFGMQSSWCLCGNSFGLYGRVPTENCNFKCLGDTTQSCGGRALNIIYSTSLHHKSLSERLDYIGCFIDKTPRDLPDYTTSFTMTIRYCINYCQDKNYSFAGLQQGIYCFCGDHYGRYGKVVDSQCSLIKCPAPNLKHVHEDCGAKGRNRIFATGVHKPAPFKPLGCFTLPITVIRNVTNHMIKEIALLRPEICRTFCTDGGFKFYAVQSQNCHCMQSTQTIHRVTNQTLCNVACTGDWKRACGGAHHMLLYSVSETEVLHLKILSSNNSSVQNNSAAQNNSSAFSTTDDEFTVHDKDITISYKCVLGKTGTALNSNHTKTQKLGDFCYNYQCLKAELSNLVKDCLDTKGNCVKATAKGSVFSCAHGTGSCSCLLEKGTTVIKLT